MATNRDFVVKNGLVVTEDIELGHATDTTIARASSGVISVEGSNVIMASNDVSALTDSTSAAIGIGTIELGHASDTTIARASAGAITVEGTAVLLAGAQTGITTDYSTSKKIGRDADNLIDFTTDNQVTFRVSANDGVVFKASGEIEATSLDISGDVDVDGTLETDNLTVGGQQGSDGQVLTSTGSGVQWENAAGGGASALGDLSDAITTATSNIGLGSGALDSLASGGNFNTAVGINAGTTVSTGTMNVMVGLNAGQFISSGGSNIAIGKSALERGSTESNNLAIGPQAMGGAYGQTATGAYNVAIGSDAMRYGSQANGNGNIGVGYKAIYGSNGNSIGANYNIGIGYGALEVITTGDYNITIGYDAGDNITTGSNNLVIGDFQVDTATGDDQIIIGSGDGGVTWFKGDANGLVANKISVVAVTGAHTLTDAESGSYVYCTSSGAPTLPANAEVGQQYTIINNTGSDLTPGLGTSNSSIPSSHTAISDDAARTYVAVAANTWFFVG